MGSAYLSYLRVSYIYASCSAFPRLHYQHISACELNPGASYLGTWHQKHHELGRSNSDVATPISSQALEKPISFGCLK